MVWTTAARSDSVWTLVITILEVPMPLASVSELGAAHPLGPQVSSEEAWDYVRAAASRASLINFSLAPTAMSQSPRPIMKRRASCRKGGTVEQQLDSFIVATRLELMVRKSDGPWERLCEILADF